MSHHHHEIRTGCAVLPRTITGLWAAFIINIILSVAEISFGILSNSIALVGDALHNTADAFSILIALIAWHIGRKGADKKYSYGFKRAETIGSLINLILLFVSGTYLMFEGVLKIISPEKIDGETILYVSVLALITDTATAKLSHHDAEHNSNMKMLFIHNLADALGSVGVIISGLCVLYLNWNFMDGLIAVLIACYMLVQSVLSFGSIADILMNAAPAGINSDHIVKRIMTVNGISDIHDLHIWQVDENRVRFECHIVTKDFSLPQKIRSLLTEEFNIRDCVIQTEERSCLLK